MSVLKIRDETGKFVGVPSIKGEQGEPGTQVAHATRHAKGGADPISPADIGAAEAGHTHSYSDVGAAPANHTHTPASIGAVNKSGDTVNGNLNVNGALAVERSDNNRKARTVVHNNADKEADFQNFADDSNYVGIRLATEEKGAGDVAKVVHMKDGKFSSFPLLHTGNLGMIFTHGEDDLTAGESPVGDGQLYFVYE